VTDDDEDVVAGEGSRLLVIVSGHSMPSLANQVLVSSYSVCIRDRSSALLLMYQSREGYHQRQYLEA
jgi:hypothetical protein